MWWWGLFKILFSLVLSLVVAVGDGAEVAVGGRGGQKDDLLPLGAGTNM